MRLKSLIASRSGPVGAGLLANAAGQLAKMLKRMAHSPASRLPPWCLASRQRRTQKIPKCRKEPWQVVPRNHVPGVFHAGDQNVGLQLSDLGLVLRLNDAPASGDDEQGRDRKVRQVFMEIHIMEVIEGTHDGGLVTGVQPLGAQLQLLVGPC